MDQIARNAKNLGKVEDSATAKAVRRNAQKADLKEALEIMEAIINEVSIGKWKEAAASSLPKRQEEAEAAKAAAEKGWEEYDKVVKAVQSGRVETMEDLKREIQDSGMNEEQRHKQAKENYERIRQKLVKIFNDVLTERGNNHSAVLGYNKRVFDLVYDAQAHRNESYEASEYFNVLSNEYQKITRAIYQSGHVETMADLKRELGF